MTEQQLGHEPAIPETYDLLALEQLLDSIRDHAAALYYIDTAMRYMEGEQANWLEQGVGIVERAVPPLTRGGVTTKALPVTFGRGEFEFTKVYEVPRDFFDISGLAGGGSTIERIQGDLDQLKGEAEDWAARTRSEIWDMIEPFTWSDTSAYDQCIDLVSEMQNSLAENAIHEFGVLGGDISDWDGAAAENFEQNFYSKFEEMVANQRHLLGALLGGIGIGKAAVESARHGIWNVAIATRGAFLEQLKLASVTHELERQQSQQQALVIAGGAATILAGILTAGAALPVGATATGTAATVSASGLLAGGFTAASGVATIASAAIPADQSDELTIEGNTAEGIKGSLIDAIIKIIDNDMAQHDELVMDVRAAIGDVESWGRSSTSIIMPIRPYILDGVDCNTFYHDSRSSDHSLP